MYGWMGKVLRINLNDNAVWVENLDPKIAKDYIGGCGFLPRYALLISPTNESFLKPKNCCDIVG